MLPSDVLEEPDDEYPGNKGRTVAERVFSGERIAVKVVYNLGLEGERVVVTVERGRPRRTRPPETQEEAGQ